MRGEYPFVPPDSILVPELPPRARRIPTRENLIQQNRGTTSACAENTGGCLVLILHDGNYLRVRGEYIAYAKAYASKPELPPRARRIPEDILAGVVESGTTSACAENTQYQGTGRARCRNYLRVRGEYWGWLMVPSKTRELPPRARRIPARGLVNPKMPGTTSACAENTRIA